MGGDIRCLPSGEWGREFQAGEQHVQSHEGSEVREVGRGK